MRPTHCAGQPIHSLLPRLIVLYALLLQACATGTAVGVGGSGREIRDDDDPGTPGQPRDSTRERLLEVATQEQARSIEAERAVSEMWAMAGSTTDELGAEWEFCYWAHGGALTLLSVRRAEMGEGHVAPASRGAFLAGQVRNLTTLVGTGAREVTFTLEREERGWKADLDMAERDESPPQARTFPVPRAGVSATDGSATERQNPIGSGGGAGGRSGGGLGDLEPGHLGPR